MLSKWMEMIRISYKRFFKTVNVTGKPRLIIAKTIKGYGVKMAENAAKWHHYVPSSEEYEIAMKDLEERMEACRHE